jgi:hypothetical protein
LILALENCSDIFLIDLGLSRGHGNPVSAVDPNGVVGGTANRQFYLAARLESLALLKFSTGARLGDVRWKS